MVIDLMVSEARQLNESRALLFIDEAHRLRVAEYGFLIDIFNELRDHGVRLKTVLVGQPDLYKQRNSLKKYPQIRQRFMPRWYAMRGICERDELERILSALDKETEFPRHSGTTYTAFFLPVAYAANFRLSSELGTIWEALQTAATKAHLSSPIEFTMQTIMDYLAELLQELGALDTADLKLDSTLADTLALEALQGQCDDDEETAEVGDTAA